MLAPPGSATAIIRKFFLKTTWNEEYCWGGGMRQKIVYVNLPLFRVRPDGNMDGDGTCKRTSIKSGEEEESTQN